MAASRFWHRNRGTALRSLLLLALLHRLNCLAFLAACAPVLLLTAFLLGVVLVHSQVPLGGAEDADRHLYKKIRHHHPRITVSSFSDESLSSSSSERQEEEEEEEEEEERFVAEQEEDDDEEEVVGKEAAVAWTADDERSIQSIGSLELERDARLEKLMYRRSSSSLQQRNLIDLDVHIPAARDMKKQQHKDDVPGSAPSSMQHHPFLDHVQTELLLTRHESFTVHPHRHHHLAHARSSRFRPYFVATTDILLDSDCREIMDNSNSKKSSSSPSPSPSSSSSSSLSAASDRHQKEQQTMQVNKVEEEEATRDWDGNRSGMPVDVELISDSSDDDMSLPGGVTMARDDHSADDEEEDSFEVPSITQQVAAGIQHLHELHDDGEVSVVSEEIREHHVSGPVPGVADSSSPSPADSSSPSPADSSSPSPGVAGAAGSGAVIAGPSAAAGTVPGSGAGPGAAEEAGTTPGSGAAGAGPRAAEEARTTPGSGGAGAGSGASAAARTAPGSGAGPRAGSSGGKSGIKFKPPSKKAVLDFFRK